MNIDTIFPHIDHTLLRCTATKQEIDVLCREALEYKTASVCIPALYVAYVKEKYPQLNICTVKCFEDLDEIANGADDIDMVIDL